MILSDYQALLPGEETRFEFNYFADHADTAPSVSTEATAWWCAQLSLLAYRDTAFVKTTLASAGLNGELITDPDGTTHCVVVTDNVGNLFFAFRGSPLFVKGDFASISAWSAKLDQFVRVWFGNAQLKLTAIVDAPESKVHSGFYQSWQAIKAKLETAMAARNPAAMLYITGHSLGGALAILAAASWQSQHPALVTFGAPEAGNSALVDSLPQDQRHYVNGDDVVTHLIPPNIGYQKLGNTTLFDYATAAELLPEAGIRFGDDNLFRIIQSWGQFMLDFTGFGPPKKLVDHAPILYVAQCARKLRNDTTTG